MADKNNDNCVIYDYTEHKLWKLINDLDAYGRDDMAEVLLEALNGYIAGEFDIAWVDGQPMLSNPEKAEK